ncbi:hypothetical protein LCM10_18535 [Rossellomorea aquimaris]|uniref:lecithin retinol acyltransferase family protein n=1 Tax=Rossellomorea aquimaris TaxID=189382 RepID=UPI001CD205FD|nr:lecithin retinol acyltransferase family protein [Rossellomorea aquimaris]MCA1056964.1 hypothetical protein [Rossellomorea aquimaris]
MLREFVDLVVFAVTEPIKIAIQIIDDSEGSLNKHKSTIAPIGLTANKSKVEPSFGSPIYTDLGFGTEGHSGIYVGNNKVVALKGNGEISECSLVDFTSHPTTVHQHIYVPYFTDAPYWSIGFPLAGSRAMAAVGKSRKYHVFMDNCHQFCSGCFTGDFENADNALWMLKDTIAKSHGEAIHWKKWDWK